MVLIRASTWLFHGSAPFHGPAGERLLFSGAQHRWQLHDGPPAGQGTLRVVRHLHELLGVRCDGEAQGNVGGLQPVVAEMREREHEHGRLPDLVATVVARAAALWGRAVGVTAPHADARGKHPAPQVDRALAELAHAREFDLQWPQLRLVVGVEPQLQPGTEDVCEAGGHGQRVAKAPRAIDAVEPVAASARGAAGVLRGLRLLRHQSQDHLGARSVPHQQAGGVYRRDGRGEHMHRKLERRSFVLRVLDRR
mmetsp:Transcript_60876/g.171563  ORF Transcript_60876/g.171563 Transcript_60876/m.171563 type:complete len:252 (+) Transcript_60876:276-1031(+)